MSRTMTTTMPIEMSHFNDLNANPRTAKRTKVTIRIRSRPTRLTMQTPYRLFVYNNLAKGPC